MYFIMHLAGGAWWCRVVLRKYNGQELEMQICEYCKVELVEVDSEFPGDYTLQCPECGSWFEDVKWDGTTAADLEGAR